MKKLIDSYTIVADNVPATIAVWETSTESVPLYEITLPELPPATAALVEELSEELSGKVPLELEMMSDPHKVLGVKEEFLGEIKSLVGTKLPQADPATVDTLAGYLLHKMYGLGFVDVIMADNWIEELTVNGSKYAVALYHKKHGWVNTNKQLQSEEEIRNLSAQIGRKVNREINLLHPIMDAYLLSGDRVASTLFPVSTGGNTITIRRFARNPWTPLSFIAMNTISARMMALLWQAMQFELNILVAGGTASGKTSVLNSLCSFIPPNQRVISIEDTREIQLPQNLHWNWVPMTSRPANPEGQGAISMLDLMVSSLRMRPDRIIVGEVRRREQMEAMFEAMHTGHSVYCTMHADTAHQVQRRLTQPPIAIPQAEVEALHLILMQYRDRKSGKRRALELAEVLQGNERELEINYLYRWRPRTDTFEKINNSIRLVEELNLHTGMTPQEMDADLAEKEFILCWLGQQNIRDIDEFGELMRIYYKDKEILLQAIQQKKSAGEAKKLFLSS